MRRALTALLIVVAFSSDRSSVRATGAACSSDRISVRATESQQAPPRDGPVAPLIGTATIGGTVVSSPDGKPLGRAKLMIIGAESGYIKIAETDPQGRFAFTQLPAGRYMIGASRPPYLDTTYGATRPGRPGTAINVVEGQRVTTLAIKMILGGVVTGIVTDERGQPLLNASVVLLPIQMTNGTRVVGGASSRNALVGPMGNGGGRTDERGVYRIHGIQPGEYAVVVQSQMSGPGGDVRVLTADEIQAGLQAVRDAGKPGVERPSAGPPAPMTPTTGIAIPPPPGPAPPPLPPPSGPTMGFAPTYFPGSIDVDMAASVTVAAGEERAGIDIRTRLVPMVRVEGTVAVPFGENPAYAQVTLRPSSTAAGQALVMGFQSNVRPLPDGRFLLNGIPPGRYTLTARSQGTGSGPGQGGARGGVPPANPEAPPPEPRQALWATSDIVLTGQPLSGVVLTMLPGMTVSGKVLFKSGSSLAPDLKNLAINVSARPPQVDSLLFGMESRFANGTAMKADRTFQIEGLGPERYVISAAATPTGPAANIASAFVWTVESVTIGGRDVTDVPVELKPSVDTGEVVITLTDRKQEVFGALKESSGRPAPDYTVVLFPVDKQYWITGSRRIATARPANDGLFEVSSSLGLPPGSYFLAAITDLGPDEQYDAKLLDDLSKVAVKLTLAPGERKQQDLKIK